MMHADRTRTLSTAQLRLALRPRPVWFHIAAGGSVDHHASFACAALASDLAANCRVGGAFRARRRDGACRAHRLHARGRGGATPVPTDRWYMALPWRGGRRTGPCWAANWAGRHRRSTRNHNDHELDGPPNRPLVVSSVANRLAVVRRGGAPGL